MKTSVHACELPEQALLRRYQQDGAYADCYAVDMPGVVSQSAYVEAFYTTPLFKAERFILRWLARRPSTDYGARQLARGDAGTFAAWRVEGREPDQLLLGDFTGRTKSWLMVRPQGGRTHLYFGSAVVPVTDAATGEKKMGAAFQALLGLHKLYSRLLLRSARNRLLSARPA